VEVTRRDAPEYDPNPIANLTSVAAANRPGTTRYLKFLLCIHRIHLLPSEVSSGSCSFARDDTLRNVATGELGFACSINALKLLLCASNLCRILADVNAVPPGVKVLPVVLVGETPRDELGGDRGGGVRSQCWLAEFSRRCLRGVGACIMCSVVCVLHFL